MRESGEGASLEGGVWGGGGSIIISIIKGIDVISQ